MQKCINCPRSLCALAYYRLSRYRYFVGSLWGVYSAMSWVIYMPWMHRCNKVTEKHVILFVSTNSKLKDIWVLVLINAKHFQARSPTRIYFLDIDLLSVACQWVSRLDFYVVIWNTNALNCSSWEMKIHDGSGRSLAHIISESFWKDNAWQIWLLLFGINNSVEGTFISHT